MVVRRALHAFARIVGSGLVVCAPSVLNSHGGAAIAAEAASVRPWATEQNDAVALARKGDTAAALAVLERLHREHAEDLSVARDFVAVTAWAGHDAEAVRLYAALPPGPEPDYVIEAVALAHLHLEQPAEALALYRLGLGQSPADSRLKAGEVRSMVDLGQIAPAIVLAESDLRLHGERADVLLAAAYAASAQKQPVEALRYTDRALKVDPSSREARHDRIMAIDEMGAPQVARRLADENPGVLTASERRQLDGDAAAALVRWGVLEPTSEELRFAASDRAIAALDLLIARWSKEGDAARRDLLRARFDRMVALRDRVRMADVLTEYEDLGREGVAIPGYALVAAADAYLYYRQPETARDLYLRGLAADPDNPITRIAIVYAYVELDDFKEAYRRADAEAAGQPTWIYLKGLNDPLDNPERTTADLAAVEVRLYAGELAEAYRRMAAIAEAAPNNTRHLSLLANVEAARGWPRLAAQEYEISRALKPRDITTEVGQALNDLELRDYRAVETAVADLGRRAPENLEMQRLARLWRVHDMAEFHVKVEPTLTSGSNVQGGSGVAIESQLYSPPIDYNWRVFADEYVAHEELPLGAGTISLRQSGAGLEYRGRDLAASLEGTANVFGPHLDTTLGSGIDRGRGGARAQATWSVNDHWDIGGGAEIFARDTPLPALGAGTTANAARTSIAYRESESREVLLSAEMMDFSDGNVRTSPTGEFTQRFLTAPHLTVDGIFGLAESQNTANNNRPYYNPRRDALATAGVSINQELYHRYEVIYDHHLLVTPGVYWEQGAGDGGAFSVLYEHRLRLNDVFESSLGVSFGRQPYDGTYQSTVAVIFDLRVRF